jgi:hypothetical protein
LRRIQVYYVQDVLYVVRQDAVSHIRVPGGTARYNTPSPYSQLSSLGIQVVLLLSLRRISVSHVPNSQLSSLSTAMRDNLRIRLYEDNLGILSERL